MTLDGVTGQMVMSLKGIEKAEREAYWGGEWQWE